MTWVPLPSLSLHLVVGISLHVVLDTANHDNATRSIRLPLSHRMGEGRGEGACRGCLAKDRFREALLLRCQTIKHSFETCGCWSEFRLLRNYFWK